MAPRPLFQSWSSPSPQPSHTTMAPHYNGTLQWHHVHSAKVGRHPPNHSTRQCHHVHSLKVGHHPPPQSSHTTMAPHYNGTQQWHHVHSTKVGRHPPPNHSTLQWHPTKAPSNGTTSDAPCNGTQQWHHVHSTIAHYNGTLQRHPAMAPRPAPCNGILVPRPMRKSGSSPSPSIGSKNPYSYRYLGNKSWWELGLKQWNLHCELPSFQTHKLALENCEFGRWVSFLLGSGFPGVVCCQFQGVYDMISSSRKG